ncbi:MAG TPA: ABC transporter ATP-binding protein [Ktedonobacter sp.]|nr:ABC transporter ATP-binding protein [Ktedonobacter sp.]
MQTTYGFGTSLKLPYDEAVQRVKDALQTEGFGVLSEIDVRKTMREKLGVEMEPYIILGACNPPLAHRALQVDPSIGLLLPCNVVVRQTGDGTVVETIDPMMMVSVSDNPALQPVADEAASRLRKTLAALPTS